MVLDSLYYCNERLPEAIHLTLQEHIVPFLAHILHEGPERERIVRVPHSAQSTQSDQSGQSRTSRHSSTQSHTQQQQQIHNTHSDTHSRENEHADGDDGGEEEEEEMIVIDGHKQKVLERTCSVLTVLWFVLFIFMHFVVFF